MRVELDKKALFALASDTRLEILQALQPMRRTVSQIAEALGIDKAGVHRHLKKLMEGSLVKRYDDHGFVYYGLSWKTRDILNPNDNTKIIILLASSIVLIMVAIAAVVAGLSLNLVELPSAFPRTGDTTLGEGTTPPGSGESQPGILPFSLWMIASVALPSAAISLLLMAWRLLRRPKQRTASPSTGGGYAP